MREFHKMYSDNSIRRILNNLSIESGKGYITNNKPSDPPCNIVAKSIIYDSEYGEKVDVSSICIMFHVTVHSTYESSILSRCNADYSPQFVENKYRMSSMQRATSYAMFARSVL